MITADMGWLILLIILCIAFPAVRHATVGLLLGLILLVVAIACMMAIN